jgi:hypothetical protein
MSDDPRDHIPAVAGRSASEARRLTVRLQGLCWPGGAADRLEPAAAAWVRRWGPSRIGATLPACSCRVGRCAACN